MGGKGKSGPKEINICEVYSRRGKTIGSKKTSTGDLLRQQQIKTRMDLKRKLIFSSWTFTWEQRSGYEQQSEKTKWAIMREFAAWKCQKGQWDVCLCTEREQLWKSAGFSGLGMVMAPWSCPFMMGDNCSLAFVCMGWRCPSYTWRRELLVTPSPELLFPQKERPEERGETSEGALSGGSGAVIRTCYVTEQRWSHCLAQLVTPAGWWGQFDLLEIPCVHMEVGQINHIIQGKDKNFWNKLKKTPKPAKYEVKLERRPLRWNTMYKVQISQENKKGVHVSWYMWNVWIPFLWQFWQLLSVQFIISKFEALGEFCYSWATSSYERKCNVIFGSKIPCLAKSMTFFFLHYSFLRKSISIS